MDFDPADLKIDVYRQPGLGGWTQVPHAGVRITHLPSGLSVEYHEDRSIHRNKAVAMEKLGKLIERWVPPPPPVCTEEEIALRKEVEEAFKTRILSKFDKKPVGEQLDLLWLTFVHGYMACKEAQ